MFKKKNSNEIEQNRDMEVNDWTFSSDQDFSPSNFKVSPLYNTIKDSLRGVAYPAIFAFQSPLLKKRFPEVGFKVPFQLSCGSRGNGGHFLCRETDWFKKILGKRVLLIGVGFGLEMEYWLNFKPAYIAGTDILNYAKAWQSVKKHYSGYAIDFFRTKENNFDCFEDHSFDVISSAAVLEHVSNLEELLKECKRVLKPGGVFSAGFGPLFHTWGGDHFSGNDDFKNGFNHVRLSSDEYEKYLRDISYKENKLADGRVWIKQRVFSYLKPREYINILSKYFKLLFLRVHISPNAVAFRRLYPQIYEQMIKMGNLNHEDLLILSMDAFFRNTI